MSPHLYLLALWTVEHWPEGEHVDQATRKAWTSASAGMLHDINTLTADEMRLSLVLLAGYSPDGVLAALAMIEDERARAEPAAPDNTTDQPAGGETR